MYGRLFNFCVLFAFCFLTQSFLTFELERLDDSSFLFAIITTLRLTESDGINEKSHEFTNP